MFLTAYPLNELILGQVMGLKEEMRHYIALPLAACALYPLLYGAANLLRGWFTGEHRTGQLGRSTLYKALLLLVAWGGLTIFPLSLPGVALAIFLLLAAELCEAGYLFLQRRQLTTS